MHTLSRLAVPLALAFSAAPLGAQSFNIDVGSNPAHAPAPSPSCGGASGQTGLWNLVALGPGQNSVPPTPLVGLDGQATTAQISVHHNSSGFGLYSYSADLSLIGDQAALMEDWLEFESGSSWMSASVSVTGLEAGAYEVFTYAIVMDWASPMNVGGQTVSGVPWPGDQSQGVTYARHRIDVTTGDFSLSLYATNPFAEFGAFNGMQIVKLDGHARSLCEGTNAACPCGNGGGPGRGCATSFEPNGALLVAGGVASVSGDTLVLDASGVSNAFVTFFQGTQAVQAGAGAPFGDGLRCAGGSAIRVVSKLASGNHVSYPEGAETPISIRGALTPAGGERVYQARYRNAVAFCTPDTFNYSNGVAISWAP